MKAKYCIFPKRCQICNSVICPWNKICEDCISEKLEITGQCCTYCGCKLEDCKCKKTYHFYDNIFAAFYYEGGVREGIHLFKFSGKTNMAFNFAEKMYLSVIAKCEDKQYDFICFVPQTALEQENRGYNQSRLIAEILSVYMKIPLYDALVKLYETKRQRLTAFRNKKGNVFGVFDVDEAVEVENKRILIVDDIRTSGATIDECCKMLKIRGAETVDVAVYAVSRKFSREAKAK